MVPPLEVEAGDPVQTPTQSGSLCRRGKANSIFITDMEMATVRVEPRIQLLHDEQTCLLSVTTIIVFQEQIDDVDDDVTTQTIIETNVFRLE